MVTIRLTWKNPLKVRKMFIQDTDYLTRGINISFVMDSEKGVDLNQPILDPGLDLRYP